MSILIRSRNHRWTFRNLHAQWYDADFYFRGCQLAIDTNICNGSNSANADKNGAPPGWSKVWKVVFHKYQEGNEWPYGTDHQCGGQILPSGGVLLLVVGLSASSSEFMTLGNLTDVATSYAILGIRPVVCLWC